LKEHKVKVLLLVFVQQPLFPKIILVSEMTYNVLMGTLKPTHSLTLKIIAV